MPGVSLIIVSHNKPAFVKEAIQSLLAQTYRDWEAVLVDSGILLNQGFFKDVSDPRLTIQWSGESPGFARSVNVAAWCFNEWLNSGKVKGELIMYLCDDDLLYPEAFETFWKYYSGHNREPQAMYASQDIGLVNELGQTKIIGKRLAKKPAGKFCRGVRLDCRVDYLQFCHSRAMLQKFAAAYKTTRYHSEDKKETSHADGIFMEQIGALTKIHNIEKVLSMNRRTVQSVNLEYSSSSLGRFGILLREKVKGALQRIQR
jgi:spore maturation protein CgeD